MPFPSTKIHHAIRYFLLLAVFSLISYLFDLYPDIGLVLIGPSIYISYWLKTILLRFIGSLIGGISNLVYLIPTTLIYFGCTGFLLKELWNERGAVRFLSVFALLAFLIYVHFLAWKNLTDYFIANA
ncbi:MAG: hypothetical protein NC930_02315 [Candidatus Omnitrophica bacterium]|nr:hypothetical protein [Candidatus Omnitrophota bacterium]